ncbi:MAG TPA: hypothetical protein VK841_05480 [Polyangiaceae bacterium]|jgi:hypothetical protein|nr:hypothetical protein [Polyangiaceae bacterium]
MTAKCWPIFIVLGTACGGNTEGNRPIDTASPSQSGGLDATTPPGDGEPPFNANEASAVHDGAPASGSEGVENDGGASSEAVPPVSTAPGAPAIGGDGYASIDAGAYIFVGYVSSYTGGSGSSIELTYGSTSFCASGSVGVNSAYQSWAGAGFNVDQSPSSEGGTAASLALDASELTLTFSNAAGSPLEIQLIDDSFRYWCYTLTNVTSPAQIPLASFNSACWDGSGLAFTPGTAIQAIQLIVPGSASSTTPFDFCFLGLVVD